ncbi:MAG TPA: formate-dependent phosphoribosylglycinamide formyltransferase, partial [Spirochaetota bacterium]|nr:formate-dependent phosphoribosylglycinamide formyltransferase [Spirochaetota bacterium]
MVQLGSPLGKGSTKMLLLGSGELGKEVVIEAMRLGIYVIACDRYENAPAMQVANDFRVFNMLDEKSLKETVYEIKPDFIVPEIEAIATDALVDLEKEGFRVIPNANAAKLTMNREGIRCLAAEKLNLKTSPYRFADNYSSFVNSVKEIGLPCVVKPIMSSSGKGQSVIKTEEDIQKAWDYSQSGSRSGAGKVIIEAFVDFDYEITLLTVRHKDGTSFLEPIGHIQKEGDYRESWQPQPMENDVLEKSKAVARAITDEIGGFGIFGVELFIKGNDVYFSEVSPRPHDTGMVTMISQNMSEFELHLRAILGLPIPLICQYGPAASAALLVYGESKNVTFENIDSALSLPDTSLRLFGKPEVSGHRRMGVALALGDSIEQAREKARKVRDLVK